jgi:hypothetical protein
LESGLQRSFRGNWERKVKEIEGGRYVLKFPNMQVLERVLCFDEFTLKGTGLSISVNKWSSAFLAKAKLF